MKAITENRVRFEIGETHPDIYYVKEGYILTTSAKDFLQTQKIRIAKEGEVLPPEKHELTEEQIKNSHVAITPTYKSLAHPENSKAKYVDYETGAYYDVKPEYMTQLFDNFLVRKDSDRIMFRGRLDSLEAHITYAQAVISKIGDQKVVDDLGTVLDYVRELMRADVLNDEIKPMKIIGYTFDEIHERSHNPKKYYNIEQCKMSDYKLGQTYALLNCLRTDFRETEVIAAKAFVQGRIVERQDILEALNRCSSAMHVMMSKYDAGEYAQDKVSE